MGHTALSSGGQQMVAQCDGTINVVALEILKLAKFACRNLLSDNLTQQASGLSVSSFLIRVGYVIWDASISVNVLWQSQPLNQKLCLLHNQSS
jgi:hypothetical protein